MNDNFVNISGLIHRQIDVLEQYHTSVNDNMQRIDNCIQELLNIQQSRDRTMNRQLRLNGNNVTPPSSLRYSSPNINRRDRINVLSRRRGVSNLMPINSVLPVGRSMRRNRNVYPTGRRRLFNNIDSIRNRSARRMTLQEYINSTVNIGNTRIPARENQIMQQTTMICYEDLSGTNITNCPISLTPFDASSNILRINRCNHVFDSDSLIRWFREDSRCPLCRYDINNNINANNDNNNNAQDRSTTTQNIFSIEGSESDEESKTEEADGTFSNELPSTSAIVYDISFSIPELFGRDMSDNQINSIIEGITNSITNSVTQGLSEYNLNDDEELVIEEVEIGRHK